jgi:hypothetical protein
MELSLLLRRGSSFARCSFRVYVGLRLDLVAPFLGYQNGLSIPDPNHDLAKEVVIQVFQVVNDPVQVLHDSSLTQRLCQFQPLEW